MRSDLLLLLADRIEPVQPERLDMTHWVGNDCGTVMCAIGYACSMPEFQAAGLRMEGKGRNACPRCHGAIGYDAVARAFGITYTDVCSLFGPKQSNDPHVVAQNIRDFVQTKQGGDHCEESPSSTSSAGGSAV